jgi:hypothetical protein
LPHKETDVFLADDLEVRQPIEADIAAPDRQSALKPACFVCNAPGILRMPGLVNSSCLRTMRTGEAIV